MLDEPLAELGLFLVGEGARGLFGGEGMGGLLGEKEGRFGDGCECVSSAGGLHGGLLIFINNKCKKSLCSDFIIEKGSYSRYFFTFSDAVDITQSVSSWHEINI